MLLPYGTLPTRPVSFGKIAASSTSSKQFVSGSNRTTPSEPLAPFEPFPRTGSPSTASVMFGETGSDTPPALCQRALESPSGMNDKAGQASTVTLLRSVYRSEGSKSDSVEEPPEKVLDTANASLQEEEEGGGGSDCEFEPAPTTTPKLPVKLSKTSASSTAHQTVQFVQQAGSTTVASTASPRNKSLRAVQHVVPSTIFTAPVQLGKADKTPVRVGGMSGKKAVPSEKVVPVKNVQTVKNGNSSSAATKTKKNLPAELHPVSDSTKARRTERFNRLDQNQFWKLSSGTYVEDILFKRTLFMNATMKIRSFMIDVECPMTESLFKADDWLEIKKSAEFALPLLPKSTLEYLNRVRVSAIRGAPVIEQKMPKEDRGSCELILQTFMTWIRLYEKRPSPFLANLSEAFWGRNSWPLLNDLFFDIDNIFMIDGEKGGLESSRRKNEGRKWIPDAKTAPKRRGRKFDLIARDVLQERDWLIVERMLKWDVTSNKFLKETTIDLLREMHTIQTFRLQECLNPKFKDEARFFGLYTGDRGFQSFELMPAPRGSYVTFIKEHPIYNLPTSMTDNLGQHSQGLLAMIRTLEAYHRPQESNHEQVELGEELCAWLYGNNCEINNPETVLASSPCISPVSSRAPSVVGLPLDEESSDELSHEQSPNRFQDTDANDDTAALYGDDDIAMWYSHEE
ncbi:hypothetical protein BGZ74_010570 [Mortierella antarctica]|nr:hypothetical protein BGZ74_010570 [Mortierella antarctica]